MKVSKTWLRELVNLNISDDELVGLLPLRTIGTKEVTPDFIELDMKGYNRADLLSLRGVALEVAAITGTKVKFEDNETLPESLNSLNIEVQNPKLAPLYCIAKIEGLTVQASDKDWVKKLTDSGIRSVNNVADVTNLVMLEFGQPMHAFDAASVKGEQIIVRTAREGEELETLDGKIRKLEGSDLLITDSKKALGVAGVMGGKNSEVADSTTAIFLEAAIFDPKNIRKTAGRLNIQSEAGKRFYHGLTKKRLMQALSSAIKMYEGLGGKITGLTIFGDLEDEKRKVLLSLKKTCELIGVELTENQVEEYLLQLGFEVEKKGGEFLVKPPYFRLDIEIEEDLIEEVARMYGYENIPAKEIPKDASESDQKLLNNIYDLKQVLVDQGLTEVQTYSFYSTKVLGVLGFNGDNLKHLVKLLNPISSETEYMKIDLWPNLLEVADRNLRQGVSDIAIFEISKVYLQTDDKPEERYRLAILIADDTGRELQQIYQILKSLNLKLDVKEGLQSNGLKLFHPNKSFSVYRDDKLIGGMAEVHPRITDKFGVFRKVGILEIDLEKIN